MLARVPAGALIDRMRHEPKLRAAEVLHSDTTWRPCTVLAWARRRDAWAALIRWPDGREDWREYDPRHIRPSGGAALGSSPGRIENWRLASVPNASRATGNLARLLTRRVLYGVASPYAPGASA